MQIYVGTSGWRYFWNRGGSLKWYIKNTPFNAVELNASFYRFPFPKMISSWIKIGSNLRWSIKVNQTITHRYKLNERGIRVFEKFKKIFLPMEEHDLIDFYLFQLPPIVKPTDKMISRFEKFIKAVNLGEKFAIEFRSSEWFDKKYVEWIESLDAVFVSIDSPTISSEIHDCNSIIYLRLHGRTAWYSHDYNERELSEILHKVNRVKSIEKLYIFLNNDHGMLPTGERIIKLLPKIIKNAEYTKIEK